VTRIAIGLAGLQLGGCQINAVDLARSLRARGHAVSMFAVRDDAVKLSIAPYAGDAGFAIELIDGDGGLSGIARQLSQLSSRHEAEVVHVFAPWLGRIASVASIGWSRRVAIETNWNMSNSFTGSPHMPLIVGTGNMVDEARRRRPGPVYLMEPPIDVTKDRPDAAAGARFRERHGIEAQETLIVMVTRVDTAMKSESILLSIAAVAQLKDGRVRFAIVGDGDARELAEEAARRVNSALGRPAVILTGAMAEPHEAYAAADVVLGMGGSAIRGLAHGKPVIVVGEGGFSAPYSPEMVPHFRAEGFYGVGTGTAAPDRLAAQLTELVTDSDARRSLGSFGLTEAVQRFALEPATDALEEIYEDALRRRPDGLTRGYHAVRLSVKSRLELARSRRARTPSRS
jgi:hypothetical protein